MSTANKLNLVSVDDYLAGELTSTVKREYLGGVVYARAGARNAHNIIATNALVALGSRLRGRGCRAFNSDTKIRVRLPNQVRFYYPDASVVCRPNAQTVSLQDEPAVLAEVLSRRTEHGFVREVYQGLDAVLPLPEIEIDLPLAEIYETVEFSAQPEEDEPDNAPVAQGIEQRFPKP